MVMGLQQLPEWALLECVCQPLECSREQFIGFTLFWSLVGIVETLIY